MAKRKASVSPGTDVSAISHSSRHVATKLVDHHEFRKDPTKSLQERCGNESEHTFLDVIKARRGNILLQVFLSYRQTLHSTELNSGANYVTET